jgi:hypothetical protein
MGNKEGMLLRTERAMVRLMCEVKTMYKKRSSELMSTLGLHDDIKAVIFEIVWACDEEVYAVWN